VPLAAAALGLLAVLVEGASTCPVPAAVEERLRTLLPASAPGVVRLTSEEAGLRVTLLRADGSAAGSRVFGGQHSCDELADAAAVVISTWQLDAVEREHLPAAPPPQVVARAPVAAPAWRWELGAGAGAGLSGADLAPAALLLVGLSPFERLGLTARAHVSGNRQTALPAGSGTWRRALLAAGPELRLTAGPTVAYAHAGVGLTWLNVSGRGFADARSHDDFVVGLEGGLRLAWNRAGLRPWVDAGAALWPGRSVLVQEPDQRSAALPRLEILLTLGLSFGR
jgi:hypothetical protein